MNKELKNKVISLFSQNTRLDGRRAEEYRPIKVEYDVTRSAEGSARVKIGDTEVITGIKMEVMEPYPDQPNRGSMMVGAELSPLASPNFETGPPSIHAIELARITDRGIRESGVFDFKKLCIKEGEKAWIVVIDSCPINDNGNLYDAIGLSAVAALNNTKFPAYDGEKIDYSKKTDKKLPVGKLPVTVTVFKIGDYFFIDPTEEEEKIYDSRLTVSVLEDGRICSLQKGGESDISPEDALKMMDIAIKKSKELRQTLKA